MLEVKNPPVVGIEETAEEEQKEEEELKHWAHPTDSTIAWCGHPNTKLEGFTEKGVAYDGRTCPICVDLMDRFGFFWWWDTHCKWFGSTCRGTGPNSDFHDCAGA